jgi:hypothetical protein
MTQAAQALRESEEALVKLCERILQRRKFSGILSKAFVEACNYSPPLPQPDDSLSQSLALRSSGATFISHKAIDIPPDMYKNQLQELAQRSCFNLPSYGCLREGPDHAPRFKATVKFNNEVFEGPGFCSTLRQAEHAVAEIALQELSKRGPTQSLAAKMLVSWPRPQLTGFAVCESLEKRARHLDCLCTALYWFYIALYWLLEEMQAKGQGS